MDNQSINNMDNKTKFHEREIKAKSVPPTIATCFLKRIEKTIYSGHKTFKN